MLREAAKQTKILFHHDVERKKFDRLAQVSRDLARVRVNLRKSALWIERSGVLSRSDHYVVFLTQKLNSNSVSVRKI